MSLNFLLEIGVEELPASYIGPALEQLRREVTEAVAARGLTHGLTLPLGTPRRLALFIAEMPERQADRTERLTGPPETAAYDAKGLPTKAAQGFAARHGLEATALRVEATERGRYIVLDKPVPGRPTSELLVEILSEVIPRLGFPKTMTWGREGLRFARPVRWLVAMLGSEVLPLTVSGLAAGRVTRGHRFLNDRGDAKLDKADLDEYREALRKRSVMVDPAERRHAVRTQVEGALGTDANGTRVVIDEGLVDTVTNLVEWPSAMVGSFDEEFLEVPDEVLQTAMIHHQKYFPVQGANGKSAARFVFVANGSPKHAAQITAGNERVLRARLADAQFFFREDRKKSLADHALGLTTVTWHEKLGSYAEKTARLELMAEKLGPKLEMSEDVQRQLLRAAALAKADLVTGMVGEFPELQGVMGRIYLSEHDQNSEAPRAIEEHYWPKGAGGELPSTVAGAVLSLIDKVDSIVGGFRVGLAPTGSQDPYALRRQALGVLRILRAHPEWVLPLGTLVELAAEGYRAVGTAADADTVDFLRTRLRHMLVEEGHRPEVVDAVFATADDEVQSLVHKVEALSQVVGQADFVEIAGAAKRVLNILRQAETKFGLSNVQRPAVLAGTEPAEDALIAALPATRQSIHRCLSGGDHLGAFRCLAALRPQVDAFFDSVRVMDEDPAKRDLRLALLGEFRALFADMADISRIAVEKD